MIERQTTGGHDAMDMGVVLELLVPGVQQAEETDLSAEMSGSASDFEQSFRTGPEQKTIEDRAVLQSKWCQL